MRILVLQKHLRKYRDAVASTPAHVLRHDERAQHMIYACSSAEGALYRAYQHASGMGL